MFCFWAAVAFTTALFYYNTPLGNIYGCAGKHFLWATVRKSNFFV